MRSLSVTIQMKATEQYFPVVPFIVQYKMVLTFESVDGILAGVTVQIKAIGQNLPVALFLSVSLEGELPSK